MPAETPARNDPGLVAGQVNQFLDINVQVIAHLLQHENQVFCCQVTGCTGGKGATTQAAQGRLDLADTGFDRCQCVDQPHIPRVVDVDHQVQLWIGLLDRSDSPADLGRIGDPDRVAEVDGPDAQVHLRSDERDHVFFRLFPFERAAKGGGQVEADIHFRIGFQNLGYFSL